jgi:class 3 adenylate cyclase
MTEPSLPEGIVTFLFTDIEGSTQMLNRLGDSYAGVLMRHRELVDEAIAAHEGVVVRTEGDAFFAVFQKASRAVTAAVAAQRALAAEPWPPNSPLRVRMGLHSGEADLVRGDYVGLSVHVAARVSAAASGGQILITEATAELAGNPDTSDLGRHVLKDVGDFRLLQLRVPGLPDAFPAPRSLSAPNNIPAPVDSFVGRQAEMSEVAKAIAAHRLVTLTGAGGSGKTRLAVETASSVVTEFSDGVWLVPLATVDVGGRVIDAVAQALHVSDRPDQAISDTLDEWLRNRHALLVLDNCEHVVEPVAEFCERFLPACPRLHVLATSREVLGARGEHAIRTPPLAVPENPAAAARSDAVQLFVERAIAAVPTFAVDA